MSRLDQPQYQGVLDKCLNTHNPELAKISQEIKSNLDTIIENSENSKGVLAVIVTSLLKKITDHGQDI